MLAGSKSVENNMKMSHRVHKSVRFFTSRTLEKRSKSTVRAASACMQPRKLVKTLFLTILERFQALLCSRVARVTPHLECHRVFCWLCKLDSKKIARASRAFFFPEGESMGASFCHAVLKLHPFCWRSPTIWDLRRLRGRQFTRISTQLRAKTMTLPHVHL